MIENTEDETQYPIVLGFGSHRTIAGVADDEERITAMETVIGKPKRAGCMVGLGSRDRYIGDEALSKRGNVNLTYPFTSGKLTELDEAESLLHHLFYNELRIAPEEHYILVAESPLSNDETREKLTQLLFETFAVPGVYFESEAALSVISGGKLDGVVLNSGHWGSYAVQVRDGKVVPNSLKTTDFAGYELTTQLMQTCTNNGWWNFMSEAGRYVINNIKEKNCFVQVNNEEHAPIEYELPNGKKIMLGNERYSTPEALFNPSLIGNSSLGLHDLVLASVGDHVELLQNIVPCGGNTMFPNLMQRLASEITSKTNATVNVAIPQDLGRAKYYSYVGGCIFANQSGFAELCYNKHEYDENGPSGSFAKCPRTYQ
jgi:actin-related protein